MDNGMCSAEARSANGFDPEMILDWLSEEDPERLVLLWRMADRVRREQVGKSVHFRGLVEISNHCIRNCRYCGLRAGIPGRTRYRMRDDEILACVQEAVQRGMGTVVLQAGEDPGLDRERVAGLVRRIKQETELAVTLSLGERSLEDLQAWRRAGADRYLLRFETSSPELYQQIHPPRTQGAPDRMEILGWLKDLGYEVGSGVMVGIPGQTREDLAGDLALFRKLDLDMIGLGPFIPHPKTPLGAHDAQVGTTTDQVPASADMACTVLALARLLCPLSNIPATTALATLDGTPGLEQGLRCGANVIMPDLTPIHYRRLYEIYPSRVRPEEGCAEPHEKILSLIRAMGRTPGQGCGDSLAWMARTGMK